MAEDMTKLRPEQLAKTVRDWAAGVRVGNWILEEPHALAAIDEMERRLKEVDNCICWGVDCMHQAKELDKSYSRYTAAEKARKALESSEHAPILYGALKELVEALQEPT